jgi:apolipoprotein D and lipocalin family protein
MNDIVSLFFQYLGKWYELARYDIFFEKGCDCGFADYTMNEDGSVKVKNHCERLPNTAVTTAAGKAVVSFPNADPIEGKLNVTIGRGKNSTKKYLNLIH